MSILLLILILVAIGAAIWALKFVGFIDDTIKQLIRTVLIVIAIVIVLSAFGVFDLLRMQVPRV